MKIDRLVRWTRRNQTKSLANFATYRITDMISPIHILVDCNTVPRSLILMKISMFSACVLMISGKPQKHDRLWYSSNIQAQQHISPKAGRTKWSEDCHSSLHFSRTLFMIIFSTEKQNLWFEWKAEWDHERMGQDFPTVPYFTAYAYTIVEIRGCRF